MMSDKRCRNWWFVQQLEYLPDDWHLLAVELAMPCAYIVHDLDPSSDSPTGLVKPHIHFIYSFGNAVRLDTALSVAQQFNAEFCKPVSNKDGAVRYMLHVGQDEKHRYDIDDLVTLGGFRFDSSKVYNVEFQDVFFFILERNPRSIAELLFFAMHYKPEYVHFIQSRIGQFDTLLKSMQQGIFNPETGEVFLPFQTVVR